MSHGAAPRLQVEALPTVQALIRDAAEWEALMARLPFLADPAHADAIARHARAHGADSALLGHVPPAEIAAPDDNHRETLTARGFNARQRAVMERVALATQGRPAHLWRIHLHEAVTPFALLLRGRHARCLASEYAPTPRHAAELYPIPAVDIAAPDLPAGAFDLVVSQEVLEHVPDLDAGLAGIARVLRPGGRLIATFPFLFAPTTLVRAVREADGTVRHILPPELHGDPLDPAGSLVFQVPGFDVLARARAAGFAEAVLVYLSSFRHGICARGAGGILVMEARR